MEMNRILVKYVTKSGEPLFTKFVISEFIPRIGERIVLSKKFFDVTDIVHNVVSEDMLVSRDNPIGTLIVATEHES